MAKVSDRKNNKSNFMRIQDRNSSLPKGLAAFSCVALHCVNCQKCVVKLDTPPLNT